MKQIIIFFTFHVLLTASSVSAATVIVTADDPNPIGLTEDMEYVVLAMESYTFSGLISGAFEVTKAGNGTIILTSDNIYSGGTVITSAGTLQIGNGTTTGSVTGSIVNNGTLVFYHSNTGATPFLLTNPISGSGLLRFRGTGNNGESAYLGDASSTAFNGNVIVENNARLELTSSSSGTGNGITVQNGGSLWLENGTTYSSPIFIAGDGWNETGGQQLGALRMGGNGVATGTITLTGDSRIGVRNSTATISGNIGDGGSGYRLEKTESGTLILSGNNTYSGGTLVSAGALAGTGTNAGNLSVANGATFAISSGASGNYTGIVFAGTGTFGANSIIDTTAVQSPIRATRVFSGGFADQASIDRVNSFLAGSGFVAFNSISGIGYFALAAFTEADISDAYVNSLLMHHYGTIRNAGNQRFSKKRFQSDSDQTYLGQSPDRYRSTNRANAWGNYIGRTNRLESHFFTGQEAKFETNGVQVGYDLFSSGCTQFGVMFGYEDQQQELGNLGDNVKADDFYFGLYGERRFCLHWDARGYLGYGHQNYDLLRFNNNNRHAADFSGDTFEANLELGRTFYRNRDLSFRPVVAVDFFNNAIDAAQEDNGGVSYSQASLTQAFARIGSDFNWSRNALGINGGAYYSYQMASNGDVLRTQISNGVNTLWGFGSDLGHSIVTLNTGVTYYVNDKNTCAIFGNYFADFYTDRDGSPIQSTAMVGMQYRF